MTEKNAPSVLGFRPLYQQVKETLVARIADGVWQPGQIIPAEPHLAAELGVSQGTVRKALDALTAENILVRKQGRGTFVARHDEPRILFRFFNLAPDHGERSFPESRTLEVETLPASVEARAALALEGGEIVRIRRLRSLLGMPAILEDITVPAAMFHGLACSAVPNNLYDLYAMRYGVTVSGAREKIKAAVLTESEAALLSAGAGVPVLRIDRVSYSLQGEPVEWRVSLCLTEHTHYRIDLR